MEGRTQSGYLRPAMSPARSFLIALVPFLVLVARFDFLTDDAFISFRYARNLAHGAGLVFNVAPGEAPVEGYSNFLWVLALAAGEALGAPAPILSRVLSVAAGVALLFALTRFLARRVASSPRVTTLGALTAASLPPLAAWSTGGLATMPAALCAFLVYERLSLDPDRPRTLGAALAGAALVLLRADGALIFALVLVAAALPAVLDGRRALWRPLVVTGAVAVGVFGAHVAFRYGYYGDWLPNTARAKVSVDELTPELRAQFFQRGTNYLVAFGLAFLSVPLMLAVGLAGGLAVGPRPRGGPTAGALLVVLGIGAYARQVGGDFMTMGRFLVPALPFLVVAWSAGLDRIARAGRAGRLGAPALAAVCWILSLLPAWNVHLVPRATRFAWDFRWNVRDPKRFSSEYGMWKLMKENAAGWVELGRALKEHTRPGERLAQGPIGAVGYYSDLYLYDTYGLTNREIASRPLKLERLKSPGHDRSVGLEFFRDKQVDYWGAELARRATLFDERPGYRADDHPVWKVEIIDLEPGRFGDHDVLVKLANRDRS